MALREIALKREAESIRRNLKGVLHTVKDRYDEFREMCRVFNPEKGYSSMTVREIRDRFKGVNAKLAEARSLQQLLRGKYKGYAQVDTGIQRELEELVLMYKKDYRYFEHNRSMWEERERGQRGLPTSILSHLHDIYSEHPPPPSVIICFRGDPSSLETVKQRLKLGRRDIYEQREGEAWVLLTGIKPLEPSLLRRKLIETLFQGVAGEIKGAAIQITHWEEESEKTVRDISRALAEVETGEINVL